MLYDLTIPQFMKMLGNLSSLLEKGGQYAEAKKFDTDVLLQSRLAPDQFNLIRQIQITCDTAKLGVSRLTGKEAPKHDDDEKTLDDLKQRVQSTMSYLEGFSGKDFETSLQEKITTSRWDGQYVTGEEFAIQHMIPNFYFHLTTAYAILRHNGVDLGKKDYLGPLPFKR